MTNNKESNERKKDEGKRVRNRRGSNHSSSLTKETKKLNKWKIAFLTLFFIVLAFVLVIGQLAFTNREPNLKKNNISVEDKGESSFEVVLTKGQVNQITKYYLNDYLKDTGAKYNFTLENEALLTGTFKILGHDLDLYLYFEPYVLENGNVQLKAKSLSIGALELPMSYVMNSVSKSLKLPEWVEFNSDEQWVILHLDQFKLANGMYMKAKKINLLEDDIRFNVYLPISDK